MPPIILYDGVCGLCNRLVQFILRRDPNAIFRFASLQSFFSAAILARHNANSADLDTVYVVLDHGESNETLLARSNATIFILKQLGGFWRAAAWLIRLMPRALRDWFYRIVARNRYRIFGRYDTCQLPSAETRSLFLDQ